MEEVHETERGYRGQEKIFVSVPAQPPAMLPHLFVVFAGPNNIEFNVMPVTIRKQ